MGKKKPFVLRLDEDILRSVEKWAADELRSTNGQMEWIIREGLRKAGKISRNTNSSNEKGKSQGTEEGA